MRPFGQSGPAISAMQQQPAIPQQQQNPFANYSANANGPNAGFVGHTQSFTNATGVFEEYLVKSVACEARNFGMATHNFSAEMLRWDDYREVKGINDGTPALRPTFDTNAAGMMDGGLPFGGHREVTTKTVGGSTEKINHLYKVFVCHPRIAGNPTGQDFCSEMDRWDAMRTEKGINDSTPNMRQTFAPKGPTGNCLLTSTDTDVSRAGPSTVAGGVGGMGGAVVNATGLDATGRFVGYQTETVDSKGTRSYNLYKVQVCKPCYESAPVHNYCTEMQRWDDYRTAKGINDGIGSLTQIFDVPPAPQQGVGGPAMGGGSMMAAAGGAFGRPPGMMGGAPPAAGAFGRPAAPGGFGQGAPAPGGPAGFGQPQQQGGFGAGGFGRR